MYIQFFGGARTVTGSCFMLKTKKSTIMIDCGLFQGSKSLKENNYGDLPFDPTSIDALILTHAHIDHSGRIPKLTKQGFKGKIYTTEATMKLCSIMLPDCAHIQEMEIEQKNRKLERKGLPLLEPIYTVEDSIKAMDYFVPVAYNYKRHLTEDIEMRLQDAGHILGSALIELWITEDGKTEKITFSGDLGNLDQPIVKDPTIVKETDYVVIESTYGNREHDDLVDPQVRLKEIINRTYNRGGNIVIPAFAVGRVQELLYDIGHLMRTKEIPKMKVYVDSPLAVNATEIFRMSKKYFDDETMSLYNNGIDPLDFPELELSLTVDDSIALNDVKHSIIISASGMCDAGRIKHHLKHNLWRPEATVLIVGYQAEGTLGRRLLEGDKKVTIHGEEIAVKADIESIQSYSAHADKDGLINWISKIEDPTKGIILVHGEESSMAVLAQDIIDKTNIPVAMPALFEKYYINEVPEKEEKVASSIPVVTKKEEKRVVSTREKLDQLLQTMDEEKLEKLLSMVEKEA